MTVVQGILLGVSFIVALAVMIGGIPSELRSQELPLKRPKLTPMKAVRIPIVMSRSKTRYPP